MCRGDNYQPGSGRYFMRAQTRVRITGVPSRRVVLKPIVSVSPAIVNRLLIFFPISPGNNAGDLRAAAQREAIKPLVEADVAEHRLNGRESPPILRPSVRRVESLLHARGVRVLRRRCGRLGRHAPAQERHVAHRCPVWRAQTHRALRTRDAVALRAAKMLTDLSVRHILCPFTI